MPLSNGLELADGPQVKGSSTQTQLDPSAYRTPLATYSNAGTADVAAAIDAALSARQSWASTPFADRASIFLKAADLVATKYRYDIMAMTMCGQGKNAWQAEIDAAAELCDFFRYFGGFYSFRFVSDANTNQIWSKICRGTLLPATSS
jgi:1-pyrroline-5-carboxylate dehydrogenase